MLVGQEHVLDIGRLHGSDVALLVRAGIAANHRALPALVEDRAEVPEVAVLRLCVVEDGLWHKTLLEPRQDHGHRLAGLGALVGEDRVEVLVEHGIAARQGGQVPGPVGRIHRDGRLVDTLLLDGASLLGELRPRRRGCVEACLGQRGGVVVHHHQLAVDRDAERGSVLLPELDLVELAKVGAGRFDRGVRSSTPPMATTLDGASSVRKITSAAAESVAVAVTTSVKSLSMCTPVSPMISTLMPTSASNASSSAQVRRHAPRRREHGDGGAILGHGSPCRDGQRERQDRRRSDAHVRT